MDASLTHNDVYGLGNDATTGVTNAMANRDGFPAQTVDGEIVLIVRKQARAEGGTILVDEDGGTWLAKGDGTLVGTNGKGGMADEYVDHPLPTNEARPDGEFNDGREDEGRSPEREAA